MSRTSIRTSRPVTIAAGALLALSLVACGSDGDDGASPSTTAAGSETTTTTDTSTPAEAGPEPITILVSTDDGYAAPGVDALVEGLTTLPEVEVVVYAPLEQQSGRGGTSTDGEVEVTDVELASGHPARAVDGFPADTIRVAMDEEGVEPDLVITGINSGQNLAPAVDISGTVGAARAAVARGVPALATSSGIRVDDSGTATYDEEAAVPFVLDWVTENRDAIVDGTLPLEVLNLNAPSCSTGEIRGILEPELGGVDQEGDILKEQDCDSTVPEDELVYDTDAFNNGFVTLTVVPDEPAEPAEVVPAA